MNLIINSGTNKDYIVATGETYSVRQLCEYVFSNLDLSYEDFVRQNQKYFRPEELKRLRGDSSLIRNELGWAPKYNFYTMIDEMMDYWSKII